MTDAGRDGAFRERVVSKFPTLPPQQRLVAEWFLEHLPEVPFLSVPEIARRTGASEATVVRFSQSLGYDGFADLKSALLLNLKRRLEDGVPETAAAADPADALGAVARQEIGNVERTLEAVDRADFRAAASAIFRADHVYAFGLGISAHLSGMLVYLLTQVGLRASRLPTDSSSPLEAVVPLRASDLLVAFAFPPYSRPTVDLVRQAAEAGVSTLAISDRPTSPVATVARRTLVVRTDNLMFTNAVGAVAVVLNALITEIATRNREHAVEALTKINRILECDRDLLRGDS